LAIIRYTKIKFQISLHVISNTIKDIYKYLQFQIIYNCITDITVITDISN